MAVHKHRVTTSTAAVVDDPSSAELAALVAEVDRSGRGAFLVLERRDRPRGESLQAQRQADDWLLELQVDSRVEAYRTTLPGPALVLATLGAWMCQPAVT